MKAFFYIGLFLVIGVAKAQQLPQYTQYTFNEMLVNPAVTGIETYWDVKAGYRNQWAGLQGSPKTSYLTLSIPLNQDFTLNSFSQMLTNDNNPVTRIDANDYVASVSHGGIGFSILSDNTGLFSQTHLDATYAYHIRMSDRFNLAAGTSIGFNDISLNTAQLTLANPLDPVLSNAKNSQLKPELSVGVWAYARSFFLGGSVQQLLPQSISFANSSAQTQTYAQYYLTFGFKAYLSDDLTWMPSIVVIPVATEPLVYDINSKLAFSDRFWVGAGFRKNDAITGSFGLNLASFMTLGYAYDYSTTELNNVSRGTHEIMIGLLLNNNYNVSSPRHTW